MTRVELRRAGPGDVDLLVRFVRAFCEADAHPFDERRVRGALAPLLDTGSTRGVVWLIVTRDDLRPVGYAVVTWGWSIESGGLDALLDELYLDVRGAGLGGEAIELVCTAAEAAGAARLVLETEAPNHRARRFYERHGFAVEDSVWMGRWLAPHSPPGGAEPGGGPSR